MSGYQAIPDTVDGVRVYCGIEADIVDYTGVLDIEERCMEMTQFAIASLHEVCIDPGTPIQNTDALIGASTIRISILSGIREIRIIYTIMKRL